jgi:CheY-like chemotaxis protein
VENYELQLYAPAVPLCPLHPPLRLHRGTRAACSGAVRSPIRVLIAEDDPHIRKLVEDVIAGLGHATCCAGNGAEALGIYDAEGADVVVSDWMMPDLDGAQLCRRIRSRIGGAYTYFILLTALGDADHRLSGIRAGADDYVAKPFSLDEIEARIVAAERVTLVHRRQEALLRLTRRFAAEADPMRLVDDLLHEAIQLVGGTVGVVTRWDEESHDLVTVAGTLPVGAFRLRLGEGASGRAAESRKPVLVNGPVHETDPVSSCLRMQSAIAVPLIHDGRLVGTLAVGIGTASEAARRFTPEDADVMEMLASTAAAALVTHEHARLDGVLLAARTAQHELNNKLAVARGYAEMLVGSPDLPQHLRPIAGQVMSAADEAVRTVRQLRNVSTIHEQRWNAPEDTTINLARSQAPSGAA